MKKIYFIIVAAIFCCLPLAACDSNDSTSSSDFITDEAHCVVSLPQEYNIIYENRNIILSTRMMNFLVLLCTTKTYSMLIP